MPSAFWPYLALGFISPIGFCEVRSVDLRQTPIWMVRYLDSKGRCCTDYVAGHNPDDALAASQGKPGVDLARLHTVTKTDAVMIEAQK